MRLVERHVIDQNHQHWAEIDALSFKAKNLYLTPTVQLDSTATIVLQRQTLHFCD